MLDLTVVDTDIRNELARVQNTIDSSSRRKESLLKIQSLELLKVEDKQLLKEIRLMLERHSTAWYGRLGEITHTVQRIEMIPNARPVRRIAYLQLKQDCKVEKEEVDRMMEAVLIRTCLIPG